MADFSNWNAILLEHSSFIFGTNSETLFPRVSSVQIVCLTLYLSVNIDEDIAHTVVIPPHWNAFTSYLISSYKEYVVQNGCLCSVGTIFKIDTNKRHNSSLTLTVSFLLLSKLLVVVYHTFKVTTISGKQKCKGYYYCFLFVFYDFWFLLSG